MSSLAAEGSAVLAAVQDASRRLRRCRKRHPGPRLRAALCPRAGRDEGMPAVEQRDGTIRPAAADSVRLIAGIEQRLAFEERAQDIEQSIADGAQRSCVTMATAAQFGVTLLADRIVLDGDPSAMMERVHQP